MFTRMQFTPDVGTEKSVVTFVPFDATISTALFKYNLSSPIPTNCCRQIRVLSAWYYAKEGE